MAISPEQAFHQLNAVNRKLEQVRQYLIGCEPPDTRLVPLLHQIAETLQSLQGERDLFFGHDSIQKILTDIKARAARAELLTHSAAMLICNAALEKPVIEGSYTPEGKLSSLELGGRIIVHI